MSISMSMSMSMSFESSSNRNAILRSWRTGGRVGAGERETCRIGTGFTADMARAPGMASAT
jgi:hypothetical protein